MDTPIKFDLQLFAFGEDDNDEFDLDPFDLDLDNDDDESSLVPKSKVSETIRKRLNKEQQKYLQKFEDVNAKFREKFGMNIDEALEYQPDQTQNTARSASSVPQTDVLEQDADPIKSKLTEIEQRISKSEQERQLQLEAQQFMSDFPGVPFDKIPRNVIERRNRGGVTLAEAYKIEQFKAAKEQAAKDAANNTTSRIKDRWDISSEGPDYGTGGEEQATLTPEEKQFAAFFGVSEKTYLRHKKKVNTK